MTILRTVMPTPYVLRQLWERITSGLWGKVLNWGEVDYNIVRQELGWLKYEQLLSKSIFQIPLIHWTRKTPQNSLNWKRNTLSLITRDYLTRCFLSCGCYSREGSRWCYFGHCSSHNSSPVSFVQAALPDTCPHLQRAASTRRPYLI